MKITHVPNALRVGEIVYNPKKYSGSKHVYYANSLLLNFDANFPKELRSKQVSMAYIMCVNDEIYKIGQSSTKSGIRGCMNFYEKSGQDDPGINRFAINWFIREELDKGNKVEIYMIYMEPIVVEVPGLFKTQKVTVPVSAKGIEETCLMEYNAIENCYPKWNYQESGIQLPATIHEAFGQYKIDRKSK